MKNPILCTLPILAILMLCTGTATQAQQPVNTWSDVFAPPGVIGSVTALAKSGDRLYIGGYYIIAGREVTQFAAYDLLKQEWISITQLDGEGIHAIIVDANGIIYVGGHFNKIGGVLANNIAWYNPDTNTWSALGSGLNGRVTSLNISPTGDLYAGGPFTSYDDQDVRRIARWNGEAWSKVGDFDGSVFDIRFDDSFMYVIGRFGEVDGIVVNNIVRMDMNLMTWSSMGDGLIGGGLSRATSININENGIFIGGRFSTAIQSNGDMLSANNIVEWDPLTEQWFALGAGVDYTVSALGSGPDGAIYINGSPFGTTGALHRWDGAEWHAVIPREAGLSGGRPAYAFLTVENRLVVGFELFFLEGGGGSQQALYWYEPDTDGWGLYGNADTNGMTDDVLALAPGPDPGTVYAGGFFRYAGTEEVDHVAYWNGASWEPLGRGVRMSDEISLAWVYALHYASNGMLYVGGWFDEVVQADGTVLPSRNVAAWDPVAGTWQALGQGVNSPVEALVELGDGALYVGGYFTEVTQPGGEVLSIERLAVWNIATDQWEAPPASHGFNYVLSMTADDSDALFVAGVSSGSGRVIRLDPQTEKWTELRVWSGISVNDIAVSGSPPDEGVLFAGLDVGGVWQWQNGVWSQLGGMSRILSLDVNGDPFNGGELYAGGHNVQRLQAGVTWHTVGQGIADPYSFPSVHALAVGPSETDGQAAVWVGGEFMMAGGLPSVCIAQWEAVDLGWTSTEAPPAEQGVTFQVYPNPATDRLTVAYELGAATSVRVVLYDLLGRELAVLHDGFLASGSGMLTSGVERLPSGMYIVRMTTDDGRHASVQRVTIVH